MKRFILELDIPTQGYADISWAVERVAEELGDLSVLGHPVTGTNQMVEGKAGKVGSWRIEEAE